MLKVTEEIGIAFLLSLLKGPVYVPGAGAGARSHWHGDERVAHLQDLSRT